MSETVMLSVGALRENLSQFDDGEVIMIAYDPVGGFRIPLVETENGLSVTCWLSQKRYDEAHKSNDDPDLPPWAGANQWALGEAGGGNDQANLHTS